MAATAEQGTAVSDLAYCWIAVECTFPDNMQILGQHWKPAGIVGDVGSWGNDVGPTLETRCTNYYWACWPHNVGPTLFHTVMYQPLPQPLWRNSAGKISLARWTWHTVGLQWSALFVCL